MHPRIGLCRGGVFGAAMLAGLAALAPAQLRRDVEDVDVERTAPSGWIVPANCPVGDDHDRLAVEAEVGAPWMLWLETEHFRIGSTLRTRPLPPTSGERRALYELCGRLRADRRLQVPREPKEIDPWLQVWLLAQRLEEAHAELAELVGADAEWWAGRCGRAEPQLDRLVEQLGCPDKVVVLAFEEPGDHARYLRRFCGVDRAGPWSQRWRSGRRTLATCVGFEPNRWYDPTMLQGHVVHQVVAMRLAALVGDGAADGKDDGNDDGTDCGADDGVPLWLQTGLGHWLVRRIDPRSVDDEGVARGHVVDAEEWPQKVRLRLRRDLLPAVATALCWRDPGELQDPALHAMAWSMVDYLAADRAAFGQLLRRLREHRLRSRYMPDALVLRWHDQVLRASLGQDLEAWSAGWREFAAARGR
ncbi:MAG: hypothetical protein AB7O97_03925 [Planctomycetota bacterium]